MSNPFAVFELTPRFDVNQADLQRRFVAASAQHHPDRFADPVQQSDAAERLALINEAYQTLRDPERRANALLESLGGPRQDEDKSLPPCLLMQVIDVREEMETALEKQDRATLDRLRQWAIQEQDNRFKEITKLFGQAAAAKPAEHERIFKEIRLELNALRYFHRMLEQLPD